MCFGRAFHLILMHFYFLYSCFEVSFQKSGYFSKKKKKTIFPEFQLIQSDFRSIGILFKNFSEPLPGLINRTCFSINRTLWIKFFFLKSVLTDSKHFFKSFSNFPLSLRLGKAPLKIFLSFFNQIFVRFFSHKAGKTFIPFLLLLFSWFHT